MTTNKQEVDTILPAVRRNFVVSPIVTEDFDSTEKLVAYFPTSRSANTSNASTPTAGISPRHTLYRVRSTSPTDFQDETILDPSILLRRRLKSIPGLKKDSSNLIRDSFLAFESLDVQDLETYSSSSKSHNHDLERTYSFQSMNTSHPDDKSYQSSSHASLTHEFSNNLLTSRQFDCADVDESSSAMSWQQRRELYQQKVQEELLHDEEKSFKNSNDSLFADKK